LIGKEVEKVAIPEKLGAGPAYGGPKPAGKFTQKPKGNKTAAVDVKPIRTKPVIVKK
jgi:hypothetical protein